MQLLADERPIANPGSRYVYSDENFAVLGEIVRRASGLPLDVYSRRRVFEPLGMTNTRFRPPASVAEPIIAPTMLRVATGARVAVNDPMAERMGGVSGHAGVFSTAGDLGRFARMWLRGGELDGVRVLQCATVGLAVTPWTPAPDARPRGLGWDVANGMSSVELPAGSYGHTGYTGTLIWIDPASQTYVVILTNRTYPDGRGNAQPLRDAVLQTLFGR
jgi:CubicO group peptidase (beta-lactamase class C family)